MLRSLHAKLVLIMVLLVVCLMTIAGAFLINSVNRFYLDEFYSQMASVFTDDPEFVRDLVTKPEDETDGVAALDQVLKAYMGALGVDGSNRNYFILDGKTGAYLAGSNDEEGKSLEVTPNLYTALNDRTEGSRSDSTAHYMDLAIPIQRGDDSYIIYILDKQDTLRELTGQIFQLILEALLFGLVISVLLSFLLSRAMVTPIQALTRGARQVAEGDFGHDIQVESRDEIGVLTDTFNAMSDRLQNTLLQVDQERTKLSTLFLHMTDGVIAFDQEGEVIQVNPAAEEMMGINIPIGGSIRFHDLFGEVAFLETVLNLERDGDCLEIEAVRGDRSLQLLMAPFDQEKQSGVLVVIHDVTQQVKNEATRKEFVANVSHELRTPLTNIRSYAETIQENPDLPPDMMTNFLGVILNETDRMTHIVQDLLPPYRFDCGHSELNLSVFAFGDMLRDCYQAVRMEAQRHQHVLTLDGDRGLPQIKADRDRILQVVMNILSNAIKYTPDGGRIRMIAGKSGDTVWLEVQDNGIGIPERDRERIFDRFYRVDKARSRESGGTGLGLSIAREIVSRHDGVLSLVDKDGPGTTVRLALRIGGPKG